MVYNVEGYENLAMAIVLNATSDFRKAIRKLKEKPDDIEAKRMVQEIEGFFYGPLYPVLVDIDAEYILQRIRKEEANKTCKKDRRYCPKLFTWTKK